MKKKRKQYVSQSNEWKYNNSIKVNYLTEIKNLIQNLIESILQIKILKKKNYGIIKDRETFIISKNLKKRKFLLLFNILNQFLKKIKINCSKKKLFQQIRKHDEIYYKKNPINNNSGGIGFNNSLFLYIFLKNINVDLIIESGVWMGYTSFLIDQACKTNNKIKFDINFSKVIYKSKQSEYCEYDINEYDFKKKSKILKRSAIFFDDHFSQLDRFLLSDSLNIPNMIFDDDINFEAIHSDGWPAIPTISMIRDKNFLNKVKWKNFGKIGKSNFKSKFDKKKLSKYLYATAPNISQITGYYIQPPMTFIVKKK